MARKRYSDEDCLKILRQVELDLAAGADVAKACRTAGISDATYYIWRKKFGQLDTDEVKRVKVWCAESARQKKLLAHRDLQIEVRKEINKEGCERRGCA